MACRLAVRIRYFRERAGDLSKSVYGEGLESGIWEASVDVYIYAFIKIMKSFLRRSVYVGRARKCVRYF